MHDSKQSQHNIFLSLDAKLSQHCPPFQLVVLLLITGAVTVRHQFQYKMKPGMMGKVPDVIAAWNGFAANAPQVSYDGGRLGAKTEWVYYQLELLLYLPTSV
jgi:hypothetical protein